MVVVAMVQAAVAKVLAAVAMVLAAGAMASADARLWRPEREKKRRGDFRKRREKTRRTVSLVALANLHFAQILGNEEFVTAEDEEPLLTKQKQQDLLFLY